MRYIAGPDNDLSDEIWGMDEDEHIDYLDRQDQEIEDDAERAVRKTVSNPYMADYIVSLIKNGPGHSAKNTPGAVRVDPNSLQEEQMTTSKPTTDSTHPDVLWHPVWCDPSSCHADPQHPTDVSHASTTTSTGRSWDTTTGEWKAEAQLNLLEWGDDDPRPVYAVIRFNDVEDVAMYEHDLTQLIGFLESTRTRLRQAAGKDGLS